jgi:hypothetical protein
VGRFVVENACRLTWLSVDEGKAVTELGQTGKAVLRDYINATIGFEEPSRVYDKSSKSLMRMFGPKGNAQASNLFVVISYLLEQEGIHLEVEARKMAEVACVSAFFGNFQWRIPTISEHGVFHGIIIR